MKEAVCKLCVSPEAPIIIIISKKWKKDHSSD